MSKGQQKEKKDYEKRSEKGRKFIPFKVGDTVLTHNLRKYNKNSKANLGQNYEGPYIIVEIVGKHVTLKNRKDQVLKKKININQIKSFVTDSTEAQQNENDKNETITKEETPIKEQTEQEMKRKVDYYVSSIKKDGQFQALLDVAMKLDVVKKAPNPQQHLYWVTHCPVYSFWSEVMLSITYYWHYHNYPVNLNRHVWATSVEPE